MISFEELQGGFKYSEVEIIGFECPRFKRTFTDIEATLREFENICWVCFYERCPQYCSKSNQDKREKGGTRHIIG